MEYKLVFQVRRRGVAEVGEKARMPFFRSERSLDVTRACSRIRDDGFCSIQASKDTSYAIAWVFVSAWVVEDSPLKEQLVAFTSAVITKAEYRSKIEMRLGSRDIGPFNEACLEDALPTLEEPNFPDIIMTKLNLAAPSTYKNALFVGIFNKSLGYNLRDQESFIPPLFREVDYCYGSVSSLSSRFRSVQYRPPHSTGVPFFDALIACDAEGWMTDFPAFKSRIRDLWTLVPQDYQIMSASVQRFLSTVADRFFYLSFPETRFHQLLVVLEHPNDDHPATWKAFWSFVQLVFYFPDLNFGGVLLDLDPASGWKTQLPEEGEDTKEEAPCTKRPRCIERQAVQPAALGSKTLLIREIVLVVDDANSSRASSLVSKYSPETIVAHTCKACWTADGRHLQARALNPRDTLMRILESNKLHTMAWTYSASS